MVVHEGVYPNGSGMNELSATAQCRMQIEKCKIEGIYQSGEKRLNFWQGAATIIGWSRRIDQNRWKIRNHCGRGGGMTLQFALCNLHFTIAVRLSRPSGNRLPQLREYKTLGAIASKSYIGDKKDEES